MISRGHTARLNHSNSNPSNNVVSDKTDKREFTQNIIDTREGSAGEVTIEKSEIEKDASSVKRREISEGDDEDEEELIAVDDGGDQVDIKIPTNTFLTQNQKDGFGVDNEDLMFEQTSISRTLP